MHGLFQVLAALFFFTASTSAAIPVGVASVDITPTEAIRLSGYGNRRTPSEGIEQKLFAKAMAIGSAERGDLALIITVDNLGIPEFVVERIHQGIAAKVKLPREQFAVCASHTHAAPMLSGMVSNLFGMDVPSAQWEVINRYTDDVTARMIEAGLEAIKAAQPAELFWTQGRAGFAKNRRTEGGPVDHDVPVLAARRDGKWVGVLVNYACHCTTLGGDFNKTCGDWAGYAQEVIEEKFPGAKALVAIGCGADANPNPRGQLAHAKEHGRVLANEVERLLKAELKKLDVPPKGAFSRFNLAFDKLPTREQWEELAKNDGAIGYHAKKNLARLDRGETLPTELPYSAQVWAFGDELAMVFLPGEVVVDYALRLKRTYAAHRIWVNAYANDEPCYIPSKRILAEGGYEGGGAMVYYDRPTRFAEDTEERIFAQVDKIMPAAFKIAAPKEGKPSAKSPSEALKTFHLTPGFEIDLVVSEPLVVDPVAIDFGPDGRLWVAEMHDYPLGMDGNFKPGGRIKVLSQKLDRADTLVDDAPFPTGVMAWKKGALVCAAPDILYIEDTDGDGKADVRKVLYSGFATHNYQARVNSLRWGLDGWVYGAAGLFGGTIRSHLTGKDHALSGRDFRIKPDTGEFEAVAGLSQQGRVRDDFGNWFGCDNGMWMWHFPLPDHYLARNPNIAYPDSRISVGRGPNPNRVYPVSVTLERFNDPDNANHTTSACGLEVYRDTALGAEFYHNAFTPEPVHNLVHRLVVKPGGTTFVGDRAPEEERSEFLASTDNFFRPAETRTGPDGALWVVDMYRYVIEHPRWISSNRLAELDVRAGDKQGRIYRVRKTGDTAPATAPDLTKASNAELLKAFAGKNGVLRDLAHRLLLERNDKSISSELHSILRNPAARIQSLHLLKQLGDLRDSDLEIALRDEMPAVRVNAILLAEDRPSLAAQLCAMAGDADAQVRLQLALSLGNARSAEAAEALARIANSDPEDPRLRFAVLSSASAFPQVILKKTSSPKLAEGLIKTAVASGSESVRSEAAEFLMAGNLDGWRIEALNAFLKSGVSLSAGQQQKLDAARSEAARVANDASQPLRLRQSSLELVSDLETLASFIDPVQPPELRKTALESLRRNPDPRVADLLLVRGVIIDELLQRDSWTERLLAALESKSISAQKIDATQRQRLLQHGNRLIAERAAKLLGEIRSDRAALVASYSRAGELAGDPDRGLALFAANCAACHSFRGLGYAVGPDLVTYHDKTVADFVTAILHPNAIVEPRFINYQIETKDDRSLSGVLSGETATSVTVQGASGLKETLIRSQITSMKASAFSLMPEGFESALDHQGMADLISYLKSPAPASFGAGKHKFSGHYKMISATEILDYPSAFGRLPLHHCRQSDGNGRVEWEIPPGLTRVQFPIAVGFISQPKGQFTLHIRGKRACDFDVTLNDAAFAENVTYRVLEKNGEDSNGILTVELPPSAEPTRFAVTATAANSQRWFGLYSGSQQPTDSVELLRTLTKNIASSEEQNKRIPAIWRVAIDASRRNDADELRKILDISLPSPNGSLAEWQAVVIGGGVINGISLEGQNPAKRIDEILNGDQNLTSRWQRALELSLPMSADEKIIPGTRYDSLRMIALLPWAHAQAPLAKHLVKNAHAELQQGSVSALLDINTADAIELLVENFENLTESNRKLAVENISRKPALLLRLKAAVEAEKLPKRILGSEIGSVIGN